MVAAVLLSSVWWRAAYCVSYRVCGAERPPIDLVSTYGMEAHRSDQLVLHLQEIIRWADTHHNSSWVLENPDGNLKCRPFMMNWPQAHEYHLIDYCAFGGPYKKPTSLWMNVAWTPQGTTGSGRGGYPGCSG